MQDGGEGQSSLILDLAEDGTLQVKGRLIGLGSFKSKGK